MDFEPLMSTEITGEWEEGGGKARMSQGGVLCRVCMPVSSHHVDPLDILPEERGVSIAARQTCRGRLGLGWG